MRSRVRETRRAHEVEGITQRREAVALRVREDRGERQLARNFEHRDLPPASARSQCTDTIASKLPSPSALPGDGLGKGGRAGARNAPRVLSKQ